MARANRVRAPGRGRLSSRNGLPGRAAAGAAIIRRRIRRAPARRLLLAWSVWPRRAARQTTLAAAVLTAAHRVLIRFPCLQSAALARAGLVCEAVVCQLHAAGDSDDPGETMSRLPLPLPLPGLVVMRGRDGGTGR